MIDGTVLAQKAMSAILRTGERFGTEHLISLLIGEDTEQIAKFNHARLPTFGVGKEKNRNEWRSIFRQLYAAGILSLDITGYGRWTVTDAGRDVLRGKATIQLRQDTVTYGKKAARKAAAAAALGDSDDDKDLFRALRVRRSAIAKAEAVPAYVVLPDRSLIDMVSRRPATLAEMAEVHGIGEAKLARYGEDFLEVIRQAPGGRVRWRDDGDKARCAANIKPLPCGFRHGESSTIRSSHRGRLSWSNPLSARAAPPLFTRTGSPTSNT